MDTHKIKFICTLISLLSVVLNAAPEQTLTLIKPDREKNWIVIKAIDNKAKENGFITVEQTKMRLDEAEVAEFYAEHQERPFFNELINYITSGSFIALILEKENAINAWYDLINGINSTQEAPATIKKIDGWSVMILRREYQELLGFFLDKLIAFREFNSSIKRIGQP